MYDLVLWSSEVYVIQLLVLCASRYMTSALSHIYIAYTPTNHALLISVTVGGRGSGGGGSH